MEQKQSKNASITHSLLFCRTTPNQVFQKKDKNNKNNETAAGVQPNYETCPGIRTGQDRVNVHGGTNKRLATSTPQSGDAFSRRPSFRTLFTAAPGNDEIPFNFSARVGINYLFSSV